MPTAAKTLVWRGSKQMQERPESPEFSATKDGPSWTHTYEGPYAVLKAALPARLAIVARAAPGFYVDNIKLAKAPGGRGVLTVTLTPAPTQDFTFAKGGASDPIFELEWTELEKKLETHPRYTGSPKFLTVEDLTALEAWKEERSSALRKDYQYHLDSSDKSTTIQTLSDNASDFAAKFLQGIDSYRVYYPVCRVTTKSAAKPRAGKCGFRDRPPAEIAVNGYVYLKTADRITRTDREWQRVQEWTGTEYIDPDLYTV